jgi:hypothetical protein
MHIAYHLLSSTGTSKTSSGSSNSMQPVKNVPAQLSYDDEPSAVQKFLNPPKEELPNDFEVLILPRHVLPINLL